jgi:anti-sigma factor RsiW
MMANPICWLTRRRLGAFRDGELGSAARVRVAGHLERCAGCATELAALGRLRLALSMGAPEPPEAVWDAFWPQVRARMATAPVESAARRPWAPVLAHPRLAFGSGLAVAAVALLAILASWQPARVPPAPEAPGVAGSITVPPASGVAPAAVPVVVQSVETAAPDSSVMVFTSPDADTTVVWVFGLERTEI